RACTTSCSRPSQKPPRFKNGQCPIEPIRNRRKCAGRLHGGARCELFLSRLAAFGFELKSVCAALVNGDDVGHTSHHTHAFQERRLDRLAVAPVGRMEREYARRAARAQVLEDSALNCSLGTSAAAAHGSLSASASPAESGSRQ